ncbi:acetamidase/formamidase family protein [Bordetella sp. N]|uniref:acetamidase/formamidase family protein n=1 Tax=Bordetella sp. N TaxID=1746199 RepID=UPI00070F94E6|nr:acetamidase/formamidase family protein [Bordetella sp. N]ALM86469.1 amidase [Bordetella sp. N]
MPAHHLPASPETIHWGYLSAALKPSIIIDSGETVTIDTVSGGPGYLNELGVELLPEHRLIHEQCKPMFAGHILTGPVGIRGAEPGDVLEVRVLDIKLRYPWGWNSQLPLRGTLPEDFPNRRIVAIPIDRERMTANTAFGPSIPLAPFFGVMGVAPRPEYGPVSSIEPREYGGNMDNKELGVGSSTFFPVQTPLALFSTGDGHAVQGDGEVCLTALETSLTGTFQFILHKQVPLELPLGQTDTHIITMAFNEDLDDAAKIALRKMIALLSKTQGWSEQDAYTFCSLACDLRVTQLVDGNKGIHALVHRSLLTRDISMDQLRA